MPRIPLIEKKQDVAAEYHTVFDRIPESRGQVRGPFGVFMHSPVVADRSAHLGAYLRFESKLAPAERELVVLTVARTMDCRYEWAAHAPMARKAGVREEAIAILRDGKAPAGLTHAEAEIVAYVRQVLVNHRVEDGTFTALRERLGVASLVELTAMTGYYAMLACSLNAFDVTPPAGSDLLPDR